MIFLKAIFFIKRVIIPFFRQTTSLFFHLPEEKNIRFHFQTDFKEFYGDPVFTFLLNYKMELAKKLLQEQQLNVNEIAVHLGYSTSSHFIAAFKRKYKITPKQFSKS